MTREKAELIMALAATAELSARGPGVTVSDVVGKQLDVPRGEALTLMQEARDIVNGNLCPCCKRRLT